MKKWSSVLLAALAASLAACAGRPAAPQPTAPARAVQAPAPAAVNPVGTFDFTTTVEGSLVNGTITVVRTDTGFGGSIATTATETVPVRTVVVAGQKVTVTADTPDGPVVFIMDFKGDEFAGTWSYATMTGTHTGKRRAS